MPVFFALSAEKIAVSKVTLTYVKVLIYIRKDSENLRNGLLPIKKPSGIHP